MTDDVEMFLPTEGIHNVRDYGGWLTEDGRQVLTQQPGKEAWPITGATFILMYKNPENPENSANALKFFDWAYANGDKMASELDYVPMPDKVKAMVRKQWADSIKDASGKAVAYK